MKDEYFFYAQIFMPGENEWTGGKLIRNRKTFAFYSTDNACFLSLFESYWKGNLKVKRKQLECILEIPFKLKEKRNEIECNSNNAF